MNKTILLLMTGMIISGAELSYAQQRTYTMAQATNGLRQDLAPERIKQFEWIPGEDAYTRAVTANGAAAWVKYGVSARKSAASPADTLLTLSQFSKQLFAGAKSLRGFPVMHWLSGTEAWCNIENTLYSGRLENGAMQFHVWCTLPVDAENITVNPQSRQIAYTIKNNLLLHNTSGVTQQITNDTDVNIVNGKSVHREEFGIDKGIFFSPKGDLVAFYRMDQRMVNDYPIVDWSVVPAHANIIKYPMAGGKSHEVTLGIYQPSTQKTVFLKTGGPADHYLTCVTWAPDQQSVYVALLNREQNHLWLNQYNAVTGELMKTLFEETDNKYVQPTHPLTFIPGKPDQFIWWSNRDGYTHLYLYNTQGQLERQLTKGSWVVNELAGFHIAGNEVVITAAKESPMEKHGYAVNLKTAALRRLDQAAGWHDIQVSSNGAYLLDSYSAGNVPGVAQLAALSGKWQEQLLTAADPLRDFKRPEIRQVTLKADDGTPLYGKLILPVDFDSTRQYPVIVYLYNGPNVQLIHNTFPYSGNLWYEYMAQHGYIIFTMDGRGSANRGMAFEQATFRQLGTVEMNDQLQGVAYLKSLPYVNQQKMGVHGWSFGGFMTTSLMLRHPGVFQAAVAGGPVIDWSMYEVMYTERYMDTPQENPEGYATSNLLTKTKNLQGHLMLIHGTNDDVVVWQHSINFLKACVDNEVQVDYFVYPGHLHNVLGKDRTHLMQKITDYFDANLKL
ncbi:MAG TPA: DPP IV N-terminal domain-containing protein [Chitinophaga sp.]|uniref:S9 family peptidase n=1 Tax=Chitinophaga sp. TaxID=1869181 RepID=UPI002BE429D6|nr:DPP IV N-terminal domain-containing protein [Chitinophaga sp.]HVI49080.1 DPP IV N-terminal domain-containing protein [Chitinophaga sp.]